LARKKSALIGVNLRLKLFAGLAQPNQPEADQPLAEADPSQPKADPSSGGLWRSFGVKIFVKSFC